MKKLFSVLLTFCLLLSLVSVIGMTAYADTLADGYYLTGTHNNWDAANLTEALRFRASSGDPAEFILETTLTEGQEFKVVYVENGAVSAWYPDGANNNYVVDANHAGPAMIYFRNSYWNDWSANGGFVWVAQKTPVSYLDENGETQTCTEYTTANYAGLNWSGWIVAHEDIYLNGRVETVGDVHLILVDGKTTQARAGVHVPETSSFTVYGQAENTGTLTAEIDNEDFTLFDDFNLDWPIAGIGSQYLNAESISESCGDITINGGVVNAYGWGGCGIGNGDGNVPTGDIVINGGYVNAGSDPFLSAGIGNAWGGPRVENTGTITINGGEVHATGFVGIGDASSGGTLITINGGIVESDGIGTRADGDYGAPTVINGGTVTVHAAAGSGAISLGGTPIQSRRTTFTVNGGQLISDVVIGTAGTDISLGWTEATDFIQAPGYNGTVTLADDWAVDGSDETFSAGAVSDNAELANKKLIPPVPEVLDPILDTSLRLYTSLNLGIEITENISVRKTQMDNFDSWYIQVDKLDAEGNVLETFRYGDGQTGAVELGNPMHSATFTGITAKEMGVSFVASVHCFEANGQEHYKEAEPTSFKEYLISELLNTGNADATRTLCADMLNYGAAAQNYFGYDTDNLVNANLSSDAQAAMNHFATAGQPAADLTNTTSANMSCTVSVMNRIVVSIRGRRLNAGDAEVKFEVKDGDGNVRTVLDTTSIGSSFIADFDGMEAEDMREPFTFTALVDGVATGEPVTWSVEGYVKEARAIDLSTLDPETQEVKMKELALFNALLTYVDSVAANGN